MRWVAMIRSSWKLTASAMLFVPSGLKDGPLPTHYEPVESPVRNLIYRQQTNPAAKLWAEARQRVA